MSQKHPAFEGQISSQKKAEKTRKLVLRRDTTLSLPSKNKSPAARPPAALQGFGIQVIVQNLFTTTSSKNLY